MPVRRYRSIEEMEEPARRSGDPAAHALPGTPGRSIPARALRPGVRRYRSLDEQEEDPPTRRDRS